MPAESTRHGVDAAADLLGSRPQLSPQPSQLPTMRHRSIDPIQVQRRVKDTQHPFLLRAEPVPIGPRQRCHIEMLVHPGTEACPRRFVETTPRGPKIQRRFEVRSPSQHERRRKHAAAEMLPPNPFPQRGVDCLPDGHLVAPVSPA